MIFGLIWYFIVVLETTDEDYIYIYIIYLKHISATRSHSLHMLTLATALTNNFVTNSYLLPVYVLRPVLSISIQGFFFSLSKILIIWIRNMTKA